MPERRAAKQRLDACDHMRVHRQLALIRLKIQRFSRELSLTQTRFNYSTKLCPLLGPLVEARSAVFRDGDAL